LNEEVKLIPGDPSSNGWFGVSVSIRGDFALVGGPTLGNTELAGAAYLYERPDAGWASAEPLSEDARLTPDDSEIEDRFGNSVSLSGETALIGAPDASRDDNAGYIFDLFGPVDTDEDGVVDEADLCPDTQAATFVDANGCSDFQVDPDHDLFCSPGAPSAGPSACSGTDNCPIDANPMQEDGDSDGAGSVCDVCPGDATDSCDVSGSGGAEITVGSGGTLQTPSGVLTIDVPPGSVGQDVTITATQLEKPAGDVDLILSGGKGKGKVRVYVDFEPDGQTFDPSATLTFMVDVTTLKNKQIQKLDLYRRNLDGKFEALGANCTTNDPPPPIIATCSVLIDHFSEYAFIVPSDTDGDEVLDEFTDELDNCPAVANPDQSDVDNNGLGDLCDPEYLFHAGFE